jgi:LysM repeat protein
MKLPFRPPKKKKLQAATVRRAREADFTEEPNVKLSSAFLVVLILHVVAVGGIYAFSTIHAHQPAAFEETPAPASAPAVTQPSANSQAAADAPGTDPAPAESTPAPTRTYVVKIGDTISKIAAANGVNANDIVALNSRLQQQHAPYVGEKLTLPGTATAPAASQPDAAKTSVPKDSGTTYTVTHGDTPVGIARKLHVAYNDLIRLNNIEDPKKLKIGMKLKIPLKHPAA